MTFFPLARLFCSALIKSSGKCVSTPIFNLSIDLLIIIKKCVTDFIWTCQNKHHLSRGSNTDTMTPPSPVGFRKIWGKSCFLFACWQGNGEFANFQDGGGLVQDGGGLEEQWVLKNSTNLLSAHGDVTHGTPWEFVSSLLWGHSPG